LVFLPQQGKPAKYGMAGCGLGSMVFKSNDSLSQILAATTNGTSGSQTFGITSGTSNCKADEVAMKRTIRKYFASSNLNTLKADISKGYGERLNTYAYLFGCPVRLYPRFSKVLKKNYNNIFKSNTSSYLNAMVIEIIKKDKKLGRYCKAL
jgi:hypothetical protein